MIQALLKYKVSLQEAKKNYQDDICSEFKVELSGVVIDTSVIDAKKKRITNEVVKHEFITEFESFMMKTTLQPLTALELFIKNKSDYIWKTSFKIFKVD